MLLLSTAATQLVFILLPEAVTHWEEVPAALLVHVPHIRLLTCVLRVRLIDQVHQEEPDERENNYFFIFFFNLNVHVVG